MSTVGNKNRSGAPRLCLTCGDPAGIGPELVAVALTPLLERGWQPLVIMPSRLLERTRELIGVDVPYRVAPPAEAVPPERVHLWFPGDETGEMPPGAVSREGGCISLLALETAVEVVKAHPGIPLVTAPVNKQSLALAGFSFPGQTEFLGARDGVSAPCMIMYHEQISTALATIHLPLKDVSAALSVELLVETIRDYHAFLSRLGRSDTIRVLALNPHASDGGLFGDEEERIIKPALAEAAQAGVLVEGPLAPDSAFGRPGCYVVMYHDQGMVPFKLLAGWEGVNVTWGLSFVRTSPDHGTAFPIAWRGEADPSSMHAAVELAVRLAL